MKSQFFRNVTVPEWKKLGKSLNQIISQNKSGVRKTQTKEVRRTRKKIVILIYQSNYLQQNL